MDHRKLVQQRLGEPGWELEEGRGRRGDREEQGEEKGQ